MHQSLQKSTPKWIVKLVNKQNCCCGHKFARNDIVQIGIKKVEKSKKNKEVLAVEIKCPNCEKTFTITFNRNLSFRQLLCELLLEMQKIDRTEMATQLFNGVSKSLPQITDEEMLDFKKNLNQIKTHTDFLKKLDDKDAD